MVLVSACGEEESISDSPSVVYNGRVMVQSSFLEREGRWEPCVDADIVACAYNSLVWFMHFIIQKRSIFIQKEHIL